MVSTAIGYAGGKSLNPYDAINGALVANFNSLNARKNQLGWQSAEEQTPWVSVADDIVQHSGLTLKQGKSERINTGADTHLNQQYAVELLQAFLKNMQLPRQIQLCRLRKPAKKRHGLFTAIRIVEHWRKWCSR
ncbi:hypothetical protein THIOSC15_3460009 [uncultured Thiomicrorhabdus sp.]